MVDVPRDLMLETFEAVAMPSRALILFVDYLETLQRG